jgi:deazaflavin-dependent oxidoreductase (nitroreductase family)
MGQQMDTKTSMENRLRRGFKYFNYYMILLWKLGLGPWINLAPRWLGRYMVIKHTGRKSGRVRYTPVNYVELDNEIYCTAGFGSVSDWYKNILLNPAVEIWLPNGWYSGQVIEIHDSQQRLPLFRKILEASGFVAPLMGIHPLTDSDETLGSLTADYRLLNIHRTTPCTGRGGPGELSWIWPLTSFILLFALLIRPKRGYACQSPKNCSSKKCC